jgi:hypothetical protein
MLNKLIKQGYKLYRIVDHGYIYSWIWSSRIHGLEDIPVFDTLTNTRSLVRALVSTLPRTLITIYIDNYFTSVPLFETLRRLKYSVVSTIRPYERFPVELSKLKKENTRLE